MPRIAVPVTQITRDGVAGAAEIDGDPIENHTVPNSGRVFVEVRNASIDTDQDATFVTQTTVDSQPVGDRAVTVPFGETRLVGPWPVPVYGRDLWIDVTSADLKLRAFSS